MGRRKAGRCRLEWRERNCRTSCAEERVDWASGGGGDNLGLAAGNGLAQSIALRAVDDARTLYQCHIKPTSTATEVLLPDVGFGVSQILPVLVNCAILPEGSTLLLEQPEIHLHPFAQAALADILIDAIKNRNLQIIVESHSEHLLRRIQRRIAREVLHPNDVALYFCHLENGSSAIEELDVDAYGNIRNWPTDFFGDEMGELADMTVAAMERQKAGSQ